MSEPVAKYSDQTHLSPQQHEQQHVIERTPTVHTEDNGEQFLMIGRHRVPVADVMSAFGGSLNPGIAAAPEIKIANPSPLGLCGFALTTFLLSIFNFGGRGVTVPNMVVGSAFFYGGAAQLVAGFFEIVAGNTFGATALSSYGAFWLSFAAIFTEAFGIEKAYMAVENGKQMMNNALGFFLLGWAIFTFGMTLCTMKSTVALFSLFFLLTITFVLLAIGAFVPSDGCNKAGGILGLIVACIAWYNAFAGVATKENSYITAHPIYLPGGKVTRPKLSKKNKA